MTDDGERVQPIEPIRGPKTYRVQPAGAEYRPPRPPTTPKRPRRQGDGNGENQCLVTADKVDCKI